MTRAPELWHELERAHEAQARRRRRKRLVLLIVLTLLAIVATASAALRVIEGAPFGAEPPAHVGAELSLQPPIGRPVVEQTAADPRGGLRWALRLSRGRQGIWCMGVGQTFRGRVGLLDTRGVFHRKPVVGYDLCEIHPSFHSVFADARSFPAHHRIVYYGLAGNQVAAVLINGKYRPRIGPRGGFLFVVPAYSKRALSRPQVVVRYKLRNGHEYTFGHLGRPGP